VKNGAHVIILKAKHVLLLKEREMSAKLQLEALALFAAILLLVGLRLSGLIG
jgi:hypothetical protein